MNAPNVPLLDRSSPQDRLTPAQITAVYALFGLGLLYVSDILFPSMLTDGPRLRQLQTVKGGVEILLTGGLIYVLVGRMEGQLEQSEQRYRNLVRNSPAPINLFDEAGTIKWGNDAVLDLLGLDDRDALVGRSIFEFIHEEDRHIAKDELEAVVRDTNPVGPTYLRIRRDDGQTRHLRVATAPGQYEGEPVGQAVVIDVTELREIEGALRRERDFIKNAIDELRDIFYVVDAEGNLERWNRQLVTATGYEDDALASMTAFDFVAQEDEQRLRASIEEARRNGSAYLEVDIIAADGDRRNYELKGALLEDDEERTTLVGIGRDVTDRKEMESQLRINERRYRTLVEMSPNPILVHRDGEILYVNGATTDLLAAEWRGDLVGRDFTEFIVASEREEAATLAGRTQRGEATPTRKEWTVTTLAGDTRYVESTSRPIAYEQDPAILSILNDVTRRRRDEELLTTLHDRTREMTRAVDMDAIAKIAVDTSDELLETDGTAVYEYTGTGRLEPLSWSTEIDDAVTGDIETGTEDDLLWEVFVAGEEHLFESSEAGGALRDLPFDAGIVLPLGNHGVYVTGLRGTASLGSTQREITHLVGETLTAAFDRAVREGDLQERDRQVQRQNEALEQLDRLNAIIREINQTLIRSSTIVEIKESVCEHIASAPQYALAWIGSIDPVDGGIDPQHWSGIDAEDIDRITQDVDGNPLAELVEEAFRSDTIRIVDDVLEESEWADGRRLALETGYQSIAAVPVRRANQVDSVLVIHARNPGIFDEREQAVLEELGDTIGYALRNVDRIDSIQTDERTEIELEIGSDRLFPNRLSDRLGTAVEVVGSLEDDVDTIEMFLRIADTGLDAVRDALDAFESVQAVQLLTDQEDVGIYQVTMVVPPLIRVLQDHDVRLLSLVANQGTATLVVAIPGAGDVRAVVEAIRDRYDGTELRARRKLDGPIETRETFRDEVIAQLTEKQRNALKTAHFGGFYEWPRETTAEELAEARGVAASTFQYHLRAAERKVVDALLV